MTTVALALLAFAGIVLAMYHSEKGGEAESGVRGEDGPRSEHPSFDL